jgi:hypothetical protein
LEDSVLDQIPGAKALVDWFGRFPSFHDANVIEFQIREDGTGLLKMKAWKMADSVDACGYFVLEKHFTGKFIFHGISSVELSGFESGAIISSVAIDRVSESIRKAGPEFRIRIESSYGFAGSICSRDLRIEFQPDVQQ